MVGPQEEVIMRRLFVVVASPEKKGKKGMMPAFPEQKMSNADLDALVAYLATMK
jgi:mono/diheme cytochrome c family protein